MRLLLLLPLLGFLSSMHAQSNLSFDSLEKAIQEKITNKEIPSIVLAIAKDGKIIYKNAFGQSDIANNILATTNTSYQIASITKALTATGIMILHEKKIIDINAPAEQYMAGLQFQNKFNKEGTVTIRNLLNHTSGLGTYFDISYADESRLVIPFEEAFKTFGILHHSPNVISEYSNLGYGLLDYIISKNSGNSYENFMQEKLFKPLGMEHSYIQGYKSTATANIQEAKKYDANLRELPEVINNTPGAGNIYASVTDLIQFGNFHLSKIKSNILSAESLAEMSNYKNPNALFHYHQDAYYGLGWYVKPSDNDYKIVWHEGGMMGASATLKLIPEEGIVIAVIVNSSNRAVCNEILDQLSNIVLPAYSPTPLNESTEIAGYGPIVKDESFLGNWSGNITIDDLEIPLSLEIKEDGSAEASYLDYTYKSYFTQNYPLPNKETLTMMISKQNSSIGLILGTLPYEGLRKEYSHLLSLKLYKKDNELTGTIVALPAAEREYYAYPFHVELKKTE